MTFRSFGASRLRMTTLAIFILAAGLRLYRIDLPFVETYNSIARQSICASVARNFYEHGFNFFNPEINENGRGPYLYNAEMPFGPYLMALGYKLAGGVREGVARAVSVLFSLGTIGLLYRLTRRFYGRAAGCAAALFAALSPLNLALSRSVQPEAAFLFGITAAVYFYVRYLDGRKGFAASAACASFAVASKFYNAFILLPLAWESTRREGAAFWKRPKTWLFAAAALASFVWYFFMWKAGRSGELAYYPYRYLHNVPGEPGYEIEVYNVSLVLQNVVKVFFGHLLTPLGAVLFAVGWLKGKSSEADRLFYTWFLATLVVTAVGWQTVIQHSYYLLPFVPPVSIFVGRGWAFFAESGARRPVTAVLLAVSAAASLAACVYLYPGLYVLPQRRQAIVEAGRAADALLPQDARVVASFEGSAIQLYYSHRRGWSFALGRADADLIRELEERREEGADFFVISNPGDLAAVPGFERYLESRYSVLLAKPLYRIYDLRGTD